VRHLPVNRPCPALDEDRRLLVTVAGVLLCADNLGHWRGGWGRGHHGENWSAGHRSGRCIGGA
jgi:hypothetical protein